MYKRQEYSFKITIADQFLRRIRNSFDVYVSNFMQTDFCNYYDNIVINNNGDIYHCNEAMLSLIHICWRKRSQLRKKKLKPCVSCALILNIIMIIRK